MQRLTTRYSSYSDSFGTPPSRGAQEDLQNIFVDKLVLDSSSSLKKKAGGSVSRLSQVRSAPALVRR
ncbi:hypothetical protein DIPPA_33351 [Diplonema papillatum]|nr:hypothetical protein DIPPA_33351 [Diplonema papillatum]